MGVQYLAEREERHNLDRRYLEARETLERRVVEVESLFSGKPGITYERFSESPEYMTNGPDGFVFARFNFQNHLDTGLKLWIYPNRVESKRNELNYGRRIVSPDETVPESYGDYKEGYWEPREFLIASQIFPIAYHGADSMGLIATMTYNHWRLDFPHKVGIVIKGMFDNDRWKGVSDLVKKVDDLIDINTTPQH